MPQTVLLLSGVLLTIISNSAVERFLISPELTLLYCRMISSTAAALNSARSDETWTRASTTGPTEPLDTTCFKNQMI